MIGTSKMFGKKAVQGRMRNSNVMELTGDSTDAAADADEFNITRDFQRKCYETNDWVRAIVDRTTERATSVEIFPRPINMKLDSNNKISDSTKRNMEKVATLLLKPNSDNESFKSLEAKAIRDMLIYDESGLQIVKDGRFSEKKYRIFGNISGEELFVNANPNGTLPDKDTFVQIRNSDKLASFDKYDFMNFIKNRRAGYANGFSPISTIAVSIMGDLEMINYNYKFFGNNAIPNLVFLFENLGFGKGEGALKKAKEWYNREHKGKPHLPLFMGAEKGNVKLQEMKTSHKDMEFGNWQLMLLSRIMSVYGMQPMILGVLTDTTGKLNSEVQTEQFKKNAIIPILNTFVYTMNSTLIWADDNLNFDDIYLTTNNLDIDDEKKSAEIDNIFLEKGVITINQVRNKLQMPSVPWGDEPFVPLNYSPLSMLVEYQESMIRNNSQGNIDNNVKEEKKPDAKKSLSESDMFSYIQKNFKLPDGVSKNTDPVKIMEVVSKMITDRQSKLSKQYSIPNNFDKPNSLIGTIGAYDLQCSITSK